MSDDQPAIFEVLPGRLYVAYGPVSADLAGLGFGCVVSLDDGAPVLDSGVEVRWRGEVVDDTVVTIADVAYAQMLEDRRVLVWAAPDGRGRAAWVSALLASRWLHSSTRDGLAVVRAATGGDPAGGAWDDLAAGYDR